MIPPPTSRLVFPALTMLKSQKCPLGRTRFVLLHSKFRWHEPPLQVTILRFVRLIRIQKCFLPFSSSLNAERERPSMRSASCSRLIAISIFDRRIQSKVNNIRPSTNYAFLKGNQKIPQKVCQGLRLTLKEDF